jgi:succinate-semialdehyde dehydrogenase/glutarate-semialdehyde dehydrogenase
MAPSETTIPVRAVESVDPATGHVWKRFGTASEGAVCAAVARAKAAQRNWAGQSVGSHVRILRRFHECLYRRRREVADALTRENGKPVAEAIGSEIAIALDFAIYYSRTAPRFLRAPSSRRGELSNFT